MDDRSECAWLGAAGGDTGAKVSAKAGDVGLGEDAPAARQASKRNAVLSGPPSKGGDGDTEKRGGLGSEKGHT